MNVLSRKLSALAVVALGLLGCASDPLKATGLLGAAHGKDPLNFRQAAADPMAPIPSTVAGALRQAQNSRKAGDFEGAAKILSQLVLTSSDDPRIAGEYAKTLIELKRTDDAIAYLEHALQLAPRDWSLYSAQGVALDQKGDYIAAEKSYERALALKPGDPTVLSNAALSRMKAGDLAAAETLLLQAAQSGSEFPRIASNLALVRRLRAAKTGFTAEPADATAAIAPKGSRDAKTALGAEPSALERLKADPSVRVQALPNDAYAGPVSRNRAPSGIVSAQQVSAEAK